MKRARLDEEEAEEAVPLLLVRPARVATGTPTAPPPALRLPAPAAVRDARPVFLSKAQRVAAAAAEVEAQKAAAAAEARLQQQAPRRADAAPREQRRDARPDGRSRRSDVAVPVPAPAAPATFAAPSAAELAELRAQYLGEAVATKRKQGKPADRFRFVFDWGAEQDTSRPAGAGVATHEASLQFGRGLRAGVDRAQQRSLGATHAQALLDKQRASAGAAPETQEQAATARARLGAALEREARYDKVRPQPQLASWRDKPLAEMTDRDWRIFREDHAIGLKGGKLPLPFRSWAEAPLPEPILRAVEAVGYTRPSPIQMAAIPIGVAGRDVIGIAETGSGKTCAFVLPMLAYIMRLPVMAGDEAVEALGPYALVLSPTRELAQQTEEETAKFAKFLNYRAVSIVGGQNIEEQGFALRNGCEIVIGAPGVVPASPLLTPSFPSPCARRHARPRAGLPRAAVHGAAPVQLRGDGRGGPHDRLWL